MCTITKGNGLRNLRSYTIFAGKYQCRGLVIQGDKYLKRLNELIATKKEKVYLKIESQQVNESTSQRVTPSAFVFRTHSRKDAETQSYH